MNAIPLVGQLDLPLLSLQEQPASCGLTCPCQAGGEYGMTWAAGDPVQSAGDAEAAWGIAYDRTADAATYHQED